jgi:tRNA (cytosine40_48-C5)-methyltransferase
LKTFEFPDSSISSILARQYGYHKWLINRFLQFVPDVKCFLERLEMTPQLYIRTNTLKINTKDLKERLVSKGFELDDTILDDVLSIKKQTFRIGSTTEYLLGYYYIQDLSSCLAVDALDVRENQTVLDIASAPGGKTTYISQRMKNTGILIALETNPRRIRALRFNLQRCGVINTCVLKMDGKRATDLNMQFDRVLLDAPCSCEGIIAKDKSRKINHRPEDIEFCAALQSALIETAIRAVKPGGLLVYSTCSFAPEENEIIVNLLLEKLDVEIEPIRYGSEGLTSFGLLDFNPKLKNTRRFYPHIHDTLGFYIAKLRVHN